MVNRQKNAVPPHVSTEYSHIFRNVHSGPSHFTVLSFQSPPEYKIKHLQLQGQASVVKSSVAPETLPDAHRMVLGVCFPFLNTPPSPLKTEPPPTQDTNKSVPTRLQQRYSPILPAFGSASSSATADPTAADATTTAALACAVLGWDQNLQLAFAFRHFHRRRWRCRSRRHRLPTLHEIGRAHV